MVEQYTFNSFVILTGQEIQQYRMPCLELSHDEVIDFAVGRLPAYVASRWSDETVATVVRVVEALIEIACLSDVEQFTISHEQVDPSVVVCGNQEATERARAVLVELPTSFVSV